jgi:pimeloyl-ACP methyl ester carboxylesterase
MLESMKTLKLIIKIILALLLAMMVGLGLFIGGLWVENKTPLTLPTPTGPFTVGHTEYDWVDPARTDTLGAQPGLPRELVVWVWYPGEANAAAQPAPYLPLNWVRARDNDQGAGRLVEHEFTGILTHSYASLALSKVQAAYPVLVMQPGMGPMASDYTVLAENLASHGYIVLGINPTDTSNVVVFPDGRVVLRSASGTIPDSDSPAAAQADGDHIMAVWKQDARFVLDQLGKLNADTGSPFYQRLDLAHIGLFGHSFGGATAFAVCQQDARCKAGANLDGDPFSNEMNSPVTQPFLFLSEDYPQGCLAASTCAPMLNMSRLVNPGPAYFLQVRGTQHFNFTDLPLRQVDLVRPLFSLAGFTGSIDPARGLQISNAYLVAFFDKYLKSSDNGLLSGPSAGYSEVKFIR